VPVLWVSDRRLARVFAIDEICTKPVVALWPTVAVVLDVSRGTVYAAAERGEIDVLEVGRLKKAVSAPLRRKLGI
jgi:hypothetical protein